MKYFHCIPDRSDFLLDMEYKPNILASAYRINKYPSITRHLREGSKEIFLDSGMISAWKAGETSWMTKQEKVLEIGKQIEADYIAMLDMPMEPHLLEINGWTQAAAMTVTLGNAARFLSVKTEATKVFCLQGWILEETSDNEKPKIEDYRYCANVLNAIGVFDLRPRPWLAVGTTCMRTPDQGLYRIYDWARSSFPEYHIHAFGIGSDKYIAELQEIGIDSYDSSEASIDVAFNRGETKVEGKRDNKALRNQFARAFTLKDEAVRKILSRASQDCKELQAKMDL